MNKRLIIAGFIIAFFVYTPNLFALSAEARFDMLKIKLVQQLKTQDFENALKTMDKIKSLGIPIPTSLDYFEGKALFESGKKYRAYLKLESYVDQNGSKAKYYRQAIAYLVKAEDIYNQENEKQIALKQQQEATEAAQAEAALARENIRKQRLETEEKAERRSRERAKRVQQKKDVLLKREAAEFAVLPQVEEDSITGLLWTKEVPRKYQVNPYIPAKVTGTWKEAKNYCENLLLAGHDNWQIPTLQEFSTISKKQTKYIDGITNPYYGIWVSGSPEFSQKNIQFQKEEIYAIRNGDIYPPDRPDDPAIRCVTKINFEAYNNYFQHQYQVLQFQGHKLMIEDSYLRPNNRSYFVDFSVTFKDAIEYCKGLTLGGYTDWALPSQKDMKERIPCNIAQKLRFLRNDTTYTELWYKKPNLFSDKFGYLNTDRCSLVSTSSNTLKRKVRCVRDATKK